MELAEKIENFILMISKNISKYDATSDGFIAAFVRENLINVSLKRLFSSLETLLNDVKGVTIKQ